MPSTFLTLKERERLTGFPDEIPQWDLITYFTLTEKDGALITTYQGDTNRLGAALQLCAVRYLGFCPTDLHTASSDVITCLASQLQVDPGALPDYGTRRHDPQSKRATTSFTLVGTSADFTLLTPHRPSLADGASAPWQGTVIEGGQCLL